MFALERIIAHRGASGYAPENTLIAFESALHLGCRLFEFDVMLSADGKPFVIHDETLQRTTNGQGHVGLVSSEYLHSLDAGLWYSKRFRGTKIPTLLHVLSWLAMKNANANIEIKPYPGTTKETAFAVIDHLATYWPTGKAWPLVSSLDYEALALCHEHAPDLPLGLVVDEWSDNVLSLAEALQCFSVHLNHQEVTPERIRAIKARGFRVCAYTVNRKREATYLFDQGVDAIFTDYADILKRSIFSYLRNRRLVSKP